MGGISITRLLWGEDLSIGPRVELSACGYHRHSRGRWHGKLCRNAIGMLGRYCLVRRAGRHHALYKSAHHRSHMHCTVVSTCGRERWIVFGLCTHSANPCNDRRRDLYHQSCRQGRYGSRQSGGLPQYLLCYRWLALHWKIQLQWQR